MLDRVSKALMTVAVVAGVGSVSLPGQTPEGQAARPVSRRRRRGRRTGRTAPNTTSITRSRRRQDPAKRLSLLNSWKEKYPTSDYALSARISITRPTPR